MIPRANRGQVLNARFFNTQIDAINHLTDQLNAPRDPDEGTPRAAEENQGAGVTVTEISRQETVERITDPDDANTYVDNLQVTQVTMRRSDGTVETWIFRT